MSDYDYQTEEYWDKRTKEGRAKNDLVNVLFEDPRFAIMTERAATVLKLIRPDWTVLDACCGYGRFCTYINQEKYTGIDFSSEMIDWAKEKFTGHRFIRGNVKDHKDQYDCVFIINSGKVLTGANNNIDEIERILTPLARKCIIIVEADIIYVKFTKNSHL